MRDLNKIDEDQYKEIFEECKNSSKYRNRYKSYLAIDYDNDEGPNSWMEWMEGGETTEEDIIELGDIEEEEILIENLDFPGLLHQSSFANLIESWKNLSLPAASKDFLNDFSIFLNYCKQNDGMN